MGAEGPFRIVLIGPESTGKTRLAGDLAERYGVPWSPEYAREYVEGREGPSSTPTWSPSGRARSPERTRRWPRRGATGSPSSCSTPTS